MSDFILFFFFIKIIFFNENEKFYKRYMSVSQEYIEILETVSSAEIATLFGRCLYTEGVY